MDILRDSTRVTPTLKVAGTSPTAATTQVATPPVADKVTLGGTPPATEKAAPPAALPQTGATGASVAASLAGPAAGAAQNAMAAAQPVATPSLQSLLPKKPFFLSAEKVAEIKKATGMSDEQLLQALVPIAKASARPPISQYLVGAAGMGKSGAIYLGVNLEFPHEALNQSVHGEQCVTANAISHGETGLSMLAVSAEPCGHCRQFLNELNDSSNLTILTPDKAARKLPTLLPDNFGPKDLGVTSALMSPQDNKMVLEAKKSHALTDLADGALIGASAALVGTLIGPIGGVLTLALGLANHLASRNPAEGDEELAKAALDAANKGYAPYSKDPSGVAIRTSDGNIYKGSYAENAAFNPSLSPLQAALICMVADGQKWEDIDRVVLVEKKSAVDNEHEASQEENTRGVLSHIAPQASVAVRHALSA